MVSFRQIVENLVRLRGYPRGSVKIGKYTYHTPQIISFGRTNRVVIGRFCSISHDATLILRTGHVPPPNYRNLYVSTYTLVPVLKKSTPAKRPLIDDTDYITIGNDVWIGTRAIILQGVTVGDGAIIGAGAVVTHNVPPYAIVAGVPARVIKYRYTKEQIDKLLKIAWWNWSREKILQNLDYFYGDVEVFIEKFRSDDCQRMDENV